MKVYESRVRKCKDVSIIVDKKMRERRMEYEKYIIPLSDSNPFDVDEFVKVLRKSDFEKIGELLKNVKTERDQLKTEIKNLSILLESQRDYITSIENSDVKKKGKLKGLIKI